MAKAKILYDTQIFDLLAFGGIPRYYTEVIKGVKQNRNFNTHFSGLFLKNKEIESLYKFPTTNTLINAFNLNRFGRVKNFLTKANENNTIRELKSGKYEIFHPAFYNTAYLPHIGKTKLIITVYDMIPELYPDKAGYKEMAQKKAAFIKRADQIIAISKNTKEDLLKLFPEIDEKIITPIYLGCDIVNQNSKSKSENDKDYFLYVGSREGYKNFEFLIEGLSGILNENLLLYTSGSPYTERENQLMEKAGIKNLVHRKFVGDKELAQLYADAKALIFPSEYEGFGLPIIEAFKNSCPVILTKCSCFPEIAGDAGIYFDNKNINSFQEALSKLENKEFVGNIVKEGLNRLSLFSWENNIQETEKIYTLALKK